jgi:hypothetical protein
MVSAHRCAEAELNRAVAERVDLENLRCVMQQNFGYFHGQDRLEQISKLLSGASEVQIQLTSVEAERVAFANAELSRDDQVSALRKDLSRVSDRLVQQRHQLRHTAEKRKELAALQLSHKHQLSLVALHEEQVARLKSQEEALRQAILLAATKLSTITALRNSIGAPSGGSPDSLLSLSLDELRIDEDSMMNDAQRIEPVSLVVESQRRASWLSSVERKGISLMEYRCNLERQCEAIETQCQCALLSAKRCELRNEVNCVKAVIKSTAGRADAMQCTVEEGLLPTLASLAEVVRTRQQQVYRIEGEVQQAREDLAMLQDKRSAARCAEISHTVRSYVSVTLPSLADSLRSKREDLHELKLALQQWPGEQQRHETYISVLVSEEGELKRNAQALEQAIIGSETAKRHREHVRKTLASNEGAIVDDLDFDESMSSRAAAAVLDGNEIRYIPVPVVSNVVYLPNGFESFSAAAKRKPHFNFLAVTIMNKIQMLIRSGRRQFVSHSI